MRKILSIALINTTQSIREKTFWVTGFLFLFLLGFSLFLGVLSIGEEKVVLRNMTLSSIEISCLLLIVFGLVYNLYREKDTHLQEVYLSYVSSIQYLGGKLVGYLVICFVYVCLASLLGSVVLLVRESFIWQMLLGSYSIFLKLSIFCAVALLFSSLLDYPIIASLATLFTYIMSELSHNALKIVMVSENIFSTRLFTFLYHILPNSDKIDLKAMTIYGEIPSGVFLISITLYVCIYVVLLFFVTLLVFVKKEH